MEALRILQLWSDYFEYDARAVSAFRSLEEQQLLYAKGRTPLEIAKRIKKQGRNGAVTDAPPGESAHNFGLAVDFEGPDQGKVIALAKQLGFGTVSWDPAHVEWPGWRSLVSR